MEIALEIFIVLMAIILHECAHGWAAYFLGDPTAKNAGRLTLNPIKHIDPVGTIIFPGILFILNKLGNSSIPILGWAKPVPINFSRLRNPKRDMMLVGMAGPVTNILLALVISQVLRLGMALNVREIVEFAVFINILLATFNMIPIPPLDGSRLVAGLLPNKLMMSYLRIEPYGIIIVMVLLSLGVLHQIIFPIVFYICQWLGVRL